jgi:hypothetical protein
MTNQHQNFPSSDDFQAAYEREGAHAVYEMANKFPHLFVWSQCDGCEAETPAYKDFTDTCLVCGGHKV